MRKLVKQIGVASGGSSSSGAVKSWRHPWPKATDGKCAAALRGVLGTGGERELRQRFEEFLGAQVEARKAALRADGVRLPGDGESAEGGAGEVKACDTVLSDEELAEQLGVPGELLPRGLSAAYERLAACDETLPTSQDQQTIVGLLRVLDVDLSGGVSAQDLVQSVLHHTKSKWLSGKIASRLHVARMLPGLPTSRGKLEPHTPKTPGRSPKTPRTPKTPKSA